MTPLEASVLAYYITTGDSGSGVQPGYELKATEDQLSEFVNKLVEE